MKNSLMKSVGLTVVFSILAMTASAFDQPFMKAAKSDLNKALSSLKKATADKGGHRNNAISLVNQAISDVNNGIEYDRQNPNNRRRRNSEFVEMSGNDFTNNYDQPNMKNAREHLQNALNNLEKASADKGGYRGNAMSKIRQAIEEINKGIEYDREH